ncbi:MAG: apolipoprotein N-acyltransferase [Mycobacteriaceae bacterium]
MRGSKLIVTTLRSWIKILPRQFAAVSAGFLLYLSFPPRSLWFLAPCAIGCLILLLQAELSSTSKSRLYASGFGYSFLFGLGFLLPLLPWVGVFVGPLPWLALAVAEAVFIGIFGSLTMLVLRLPLPALWVALVWSLTEWARASFPFGGFPWGRIAFGQSEGWFLPIATIGGAPLLSFAVALTGAGIAMLIHGARQAVLRRGPISASLIAALSMTLLAPIGGVALGLIRSADTSDHLVTVAAIQGSVPRLGLDFNSQRRQVLDNHVAETLKLASDVTAGITPQPDLVMWPENASDIDPLRNSDAFTAITQASLAVKAPILVGAVLVNKGSTNQRPSTTNSVIVWDGQNGPGEQHDKKIIQPFGEYLPYRSFFRLFSSYADSAGHFIAGEGDAVVTASGITIGVATCYEVAFDRAFAESIANGAELLVVPTNNATFGDTEMTYQQLAMSQIRAVEHNRAVVVAATSGVSAIIDVDGKVQKRTQLFSADYLVASVSLHSDKTPASRLGRINEVALCFGAVCAVMASILHNRGLRRQTVAKNELTTV